MTQLLNPQPQPLLLGNTFPLPLIRRLVCIQPATKEMLCQKMAQRSFVSFWGHENSLKAASSFLQFDLTPATSRPILRLNSERYPVLGEQAFNECWILSPDYIHGYRPGLGEEVTLDNITGWQVLRLTWK